MQFTVFNSSKRISRLAVIALAGAWLAGCALLPTDDDAEGDDQVEPRATAGQESAQSAEQPGSEPAGSELPDVVLDGELLYQVLVGELAAKRGEANVGAEALTQAARLSRDPRLAQRATRLALEAGRYDVAMEAAGLWVELKPGEDRPKESLALIMVEQGRVTDAEEQFTRLLDDKEGNARGAEMRRIGRLLARLSNQPKALETMSRLVDRYPDDADAHFAAAFLADQAGEVDMVLDSLNKALVLRPDWEEAAVAKIGHLIQEQYPRERIDAFAREFLETAPGASRVRLSYARYLADQQATGESLAQFRTLLERDPDNTTALFSAGLLSVQMEEYKKARGFLMRHLELTPDNDQIRLYLGQVAEERERYKEARKWYSEVDSQDHRFEARVHLGAVLVELEGVDAALAHLEGIEPDNEDEFVRLALTKEVVLREAGELTRAKAVLDDAVARYPGNTDLLYSRGLLAARLDQVSEHERDMRALLEEDPNNAHALNALGYTLADATDRTEEAYEMIKKALSMRPDDPFILDSMGWVLYRMGQNDKAIEYLEKALSQREDAEIAAHLGEVLWTIGEKERAREVWERAKSTDPDNHVLNETLERFLQ